MLSRLPVMSATLKFLCNIVICFFEGEKLRRIEVAHSLMSIKLSTKVLSSLITQNYPTGMLLAASLGDYYVENIVNSVRSEIVCTVYKVYVIF